MHTNRITLIQTYAVFLGACIIFMRSAMADIILTAPPREDAELGRQTYEPLAEELSILLGERVTYEQPSGWFEYARKMRDGSYDIVFDGPHFAAWRVKHLKHTPVAVLPGRLDFVLIASKNDKDVNILRDLTNKKICGMLSPNLGTSLIFALFANPVLQPEIHEVEGGTKEVYKAFKQGKCRAAVIRSIDYKRLPKEEKVTIKIVGKTESLPNQTITVSKKLQTNANRISSFMVSKQGAIAAKNLLSRYSRSAQYFESTNADRYKGIELVLEGVVFGW